MSEEQSPTAGPQHGRSRTMKPPRKLLAIFGVVGIALAIKRLRSSGDAGEPTPETA